jgi:hypothetical protein
MKIRDIVVAMYRAAGHEDVWDYLHVQRLGNADGYRKLILSMLRSGTLVRTHYGSHYVTTAALMREWKSRTPYTVVALKADCADEWIIVACLENVVVRDDQWTQLPTEEDWSRYCDTFRAASPDEAVQAALTAWTDEDEDEGEGEGED